MNIQNEEYAANEPDAQFKFDCHLTFVGTLFKRSAFVNGVKS